MRHQPLSARRGRVYADAEDALDNIVANDIDVVLMDINLPGMDGIECMKTLKPEMP